MAVIIQTGEKTYSTTNGRGTSMTLSYNHIIGHWQVVSDNAAVRAYRAGGCKIFRTLPEVEAAYKTWRGISALISSPTNLP